MADFSQIDVDCCLEYLAYAVATDTDPYAHSMHRNSTGLAAARRDRRAREGCVVWRPSRAFKLDGEQMKKVKAALYHLEEEGHVTIERDKIGRPRWVTVVSDSARQRGVELLAETQARS